MSTEAARTEAARTEAAAALRDLVHTFAARDPDDEELRGLAVAARVHAAALATSAGRDRLALMRARIVAAAFDDVTGFVIGRIREPAFTGELTVRYVAPVPVDETLVMRARLDGRERRKLFISAEAHAGEQLVATCRAIYITVDRDRFAGAPDPR